ncbi:hypothetical protein LTR55_012453, partial [Exophiala xenobiotica]
RRNLRVAEICVSYLSCPPTKHGLLASSVHLPPSRVRFGLGVPLTTVHPFHPAILHRRRSDHHLQRMRDAASRLACITPVDGSGGSEPAPLCVRRWGACGTTAAHQRYWSGVVLHGDRTDDWDDCGRMRRFWDSLGRSGEDKDM